MTFEVRRSADPKFHATNIRKLLEQTAEHARADVAQVEDPQAKALFETTAEVLLGLAHAYADYEEKNEEAWR